MRARYYSPDSKRFITMDPLKGQMTATQSLNRYSYVQGNPVSAIDPLGLSPLLNLARLLPDVETMLNIARVLPWTSNIMGVYDMYQALKEGDYKKFFSAFSFALLGVYGKGIKGIKRLRSLGKISAKTERGMRIGFGAAATAGQSYLFSESLQDAKAEMAAGSGKLSDISATTWFNMVTTGFNMGFTLGATISDIPRFTPKKLKNNALGKGKAGTTAAKELAGEMPAVSGKAAGGYKSGINSNNPESYLQRALKNQELEVTPSHLKEVWVEGDYQYTVRIHEGNAKYTDAESIYRVSRRSTILDEHGQGTGLEYLGTDGNWYHESVLKEFFKGGTQNSNFNEAAAKMTHIPIGGGN